MRKGGKKVAAAKARVSHRYASQCTHSGLNCARRTAVHQKAIREAYPPDEELLAIELQVLGNVGNRVSSRTTNDDEDIDVEEYGVAEGDEEEYLASGLDSLPFHLFGSNMNQHLTTTSYPEMRMVFVFTREPSAHVQRCSWCRAFVSGTIQGSYEICIASHDQSGQSRCEHVSHQLHGSLWFTSAESVCKPGLQYWPERYEHVAVVLRLTFCRKESYCCF